MPGRWDFLEGLRLKTAADVLVEEVARILVDELTRRWPPQVEWTDADAAARFAPLYEPGAPRPSTAALREGLRLARWEIEREVEAIDFYLRNDHAGRVVATPQDRLALELVWKLVTEWLYELRERTENRLTRRHLVACLDEVERRLTLA